MNSNYKKGQNINYSGENLVSKCKIVEIEKVSGLKEVYRFTLINLRTSIKFSTAEVGRFSIVK